MCLCFLPPVSYTHLDVYKRQVCVCVCVCVKLNNSFEIKIRNLFIRNELEICKKHKANTFQLINTEYGKKDKCYIRR